jgi:hypothetical protein
MSVGDRPNPQVEIPSCVISRSTLFVNVDKIPFTGRQHPSSLVDMYLYKSYLRTPF